LSIHPDLFFENDIDENTFIDLDSDDLKELGLSLGHRKKLLKAIEKHMPGDTTTSSDAPSDAEIAQLVALTSGDLDGKRRHLTIGFCDLVGSTAMSERHEPEDLRTILSTYHETVAQVVGGFGGHIAKFLDDGAMIYFGYPIAHEDDAECAVRFALAMRKAVAKLNLNIGEN
jgi:class 3 adenylate cyclase